MSTDIDNVDKLYRGFKDILSGCEHILDAFYFSDKFLKLHPEMQDIVRNMIHSKTYNNSFDMRNINSLLREISDCTYRNETDDIIARLSKNGPDMIQLRSFHRASKSKPMKSVKLTDAIYTFKKDHKMVISRKCPHCGHSCGTKTDTDYIVCGYSDPHLGYDWTGCGKDWCFKCEKRLCKSWDTDQLFNNDNRFHDKSCCAQHAKDKGLNYPDDYCQCVNIHVKR